MLALATVPPLLLVALGGGFGRRLQFQHLGLQQHLLEQAVHAGADLGRHGDEG